jgi:hypothetical protein
MSHVSVYGIFDSNELLNGLYLSPKSITKNASSKGCGGFGAIEACRKDTTVFTRCLHCPISYLPVYTGQRAAVDILGASQGKSLTSINTIFRLSDSAIILKKSVSENGIARNKPDFLHRGRHVIIQTRT